MQRLVAPIILLTFLVLSCGSSSDVGAKRDVSPADSTHPSQTEGRAAASTPSAATGSSGVVFYVGQADCDDAGLGNASTPFCSFGTALDRLEPGDTLVVKAGIYTERLVVSEINGRADAPIIIRGESRETVIFDGGCPEFPCSVNAVNWEWDEETGMVSVEDSRFVILRDLTVRNSIAAGVNVFGGSGIVVENVTIDGTGNAGLLFLHTSNLTVIHNDVGRAQMGWRDERGDAQMGAHEALSIVAVNDFVVADNVVHDTPKEGIDVKESSTDGEVRDNLTERTCAVGIYINEAHNVRVYRNLVRRSGYFLADDGQEKTCDNHPVFGGYYGQYFGDGILLAVGDLGDLSQGRLSNIQVYQNVVWDANLNCLQFWDEMEESGTGSGTMTGNRVYNNVFYQCGNAGIGSGVRIDNTHDTVVVNNIIAFTEEEGITGDDVDSSTISHNLFTFLYEWQEPVGTDYIVGDPLFIDPVKGDFHLKEGSPAIDNGLNVGLPYAGNAPEIGAYEVGVSAVTPTPTPTPTPLAGTATDKWSLWTGGTRLRGANIYQRRVYPELDGADYMGPGPLGPPYTQGDFDRMAAMGANYVNISHPGLFSEAPPYTLDQDIRDNLDNLLTMIAKADMFAVISFRTGPGRSEFTFMLEDVGDWFDESYLDDSVWQEKAAQDAWVGMWRATAERYRSNAIVVGYDLMVEPNANEAWMDVWDPEEFHETYASTLYDWNQLHPRITAAIRQVDTDTPILIGGIGYSAVEWLPYVQPTGDLRTVYTFHQYAPHLYTHQEPEDQLTYPGVFDTDWDGVDDPFNRAWLDGLLAPVDTFTAAHKVPVAVNEFGIARWVSGAAGFMDDQIDLFERRGMNWALWLWNDSWPPSADNDDFDFRHGPDSNNHADVASSDLVDVVAKYWGRNTIRPSSMAAATTYLPTVLHVGGAGRGPMPLADVTTWAYHIQAINEPGAVDALAASHYDMLVLEPTRTDWSSDDRLFDTGAMVSRLKGSKAGDGKHRKLVIAYVDIGEAEEWRWYWTWSQGWNCDEGQPRPADWPDYILACDPDGWSGNYPVAYWDERWKNVIIYGQHQNSHPYGDYVSALDEMIRDGFDGVYLDWVEAFEHDDVIAAAQAQGKDPKAEMIAFLQEIRDYARARKPGFLIIQQNGSALSDGHPELFALVDAIAQESVWYGGDATDEWDDPNGYDAATDASLTNEYIGYLSQFLGAGLPVFDCEYALDHAAAAYANAARQGYVPYVTRQSLSRLTTTPPPGY